MTDSLTEKDLRTLMEIIDAGRNDEPTAGVPWGLLDGLRGLIGCDAVNFCDLDLRRRNTVTFQGAADGDRFYGVDFDDADDPSWELMRGFLPCDFHNNGGSLRRHLILI